VVALYLQCPIWSSSTCAALASKSTDEMSTYEHLASSSTRSITSREMNPVCSLAWKPRRLWCVGKGTRLYSAV